MTIQGPPRPLPPRKPPAAPKEDKDPAWEAYKRFTRTTALGSAAYLASSAYPGTYLHEAGHKVMAEALYQGQATIHVKPFQGGYTEMLHPVPSALGEKLDQVTRRALVAGAGTAVDAFSSMAFFAAGYKMRHKHPLVGETMMGYAGLRLANSTLYALSGLGQTVSQGNDFVTLANLTGFPCWASALVLASLLPLEYLVLRKLEGSFK